MSGPNKFIIEIREEESEKDQAASEIIIK